jgi:peptide/nickel transport system permease protein
VKKVLQGDFGLSFSQYPRPVSDYSQIFPHMGRLVCNSRDYRGWIIGNFLGALAAYLKKGFDKVLLRVSIFVKQSTAFWLRRVF